MRASSARCSLSSTTPGWAGPDDRFRALARVAGRRPSCPTRATAARSTRRPRRDTIDKATRRTRRHAIVRRCRRATRLSPRRLHTDGVRRRPPGCAATGRSARSAVSMGSPRRSTTAGATSSSRRAGGARGQGGADRVSGSCAARSASSSGLLDARRTSWRSREKLAGRGSDTARRPRLAISSPKGIRPRWWRASRRSADKPSTGHRGRAARRNAGRSPIRSTGDRRDRRGEPDRRLPDGLLPWSAASLARRSTASACCG